MRKCCEKMLLSATMPSPRCGAGWGEREWTQLTSGVSPSPLPFLCRHCYNVCGHLHYKTNIQSTQKQKDDTIAVNANEAMMMTMSTANDVGADNDGSSWWLIVSVCIMHGRLAKNCYCQVLTAQCNKYTRVASHTVT